MDRQLAFVVLDQPATVDMRAVVAALRSRYPDLPAEVADDSSRDAESTAETPLIRFGNDIVAIMNIPAPLPQDDMDIWARAEMTWPEAPAVAASHRAHVIVAHMGTVESALQEARVVTAVVGALIDTVPSCAAVMWAARLVRPAELWQDDSRKAFAAYPEAPILLWVDIVPVQTRAGIDAVTIGLSSFVGREIEFKVGPGDPSHVLTNVAGLAAYLIEHGDVIQDGDTIGGSDAERIKVRYAMSAHVTGVRVLRIAADGAQ